MTKNIVTANYHLSLIRIVITLLSLFFMTVKSSAQEDLLSKYKEGVALFKNSDFEKAYNSFEQARPVNNSYPISDNQKRTLELRCLRNMGDCSYYLGLYEQSIIDYTRALEIAKTINDDEVFNILTQLRKISLLKSDMQEVMRLSNMMDSVADKSNDPKLKFSLIMNIAQEAEKNGDYQLAETCFLKLEQLLVHQKDNAKGSNEYRIYTNMRDLYIKMKEYEKAHEYNKKCSLVIQKHDLDSKLNVYYYLSEAKILAKQKKTVQAHQILDSLKYRIHEGNDSIDLLTYHIHSASVYKEVDDYSLAIKEDEIALEIMNSLGLKDEIYYTTICATAAYYFKIGQYDKARELYEQYASFCITHYGDNSREYGETLVHMANLEGFSNNLDKARQLYIKGMRIQADIINKQLKFVSLEQRRSFWNNFAPSLMNATAFAVKSGNNQDDFTTQCYNSLLLSKTMLLESDKTMADAINQYSSIDEKKIYYQLLASKQRLDFLIKKHGDENQIISLQKEISSLNSQLTPIISKLGYTDFLSKKYDDIKKLLDEKELVIDFTDYFSDEKVTQHVAYFIEHNQEYPLLQKYLTTEDINSILDGLPMERLFNSINKEKILKLFWEPISLYAKLQSSTFLQESSIK